MGVSPFVDWLDLKPVHKDLIEIKEEDNMISKEPSVRYRGLFINDEWPAFGNWAFHNYGGFNAKMYIHVFELLLRLKGNYMWPAMWSGRFSDDGPGLTNAELADELGVVMGTSHHEPCCRAGEEYKNLRGKDSIYGDAWNFRTNEQGITKFLEDGLKRSGKFDNVYYKYVNEDIMSVPRMLALYKEVEPYFYGDEETKGLMDDPLLDGVTLMLCYDNHGNLRTVPSESMRNHPGGYGMYYRFDYHGCPFSYEWINTNYLPKNILTTEFPLSYFLDLAYDYEKYSTFDFNTFDYTKQWIGKQFASSSEEQRNDIEFIFNNYNKLSFIRRTESVSSETFHPVHFSETEKILSLAEEVLERTEKLKKEIDVNSDVYEAFFTQVYFAAKGTMNVLRLQLLSGKNHWYALNGMLEANPFVKEMKECVRIDEELVKELDELKGGRWYGMGWSEHIGFTDWNEEGNLMPVYMTYHGARRTRVGVWVEGDSTVTSGQDYTKKTLKLDAFKNPNINEAIINVGKGSTREIKIEINTVDGDFLNYELKDSKDANVTKIIVSIDREKLSKAAQKKCKINISVPHKDISGGKILVVVDVDAEVPNIDYPKGTFVQTTSYISIEAEHFISQKNGTNSSWKVIEGYGKTLSAIKSYPVINIYDDINEAHTWSFDFYQNPSNPAFMNNKLQFAAEVNGKAIIHDVVDSKTFAVGDTKQPWSNTNEIRISTVNFECKKGLNTLKFYPVTPNIVLEKIIIRPENYKMPESYLGAPETYYV
ncbi:alpha-glucuronidase Gh115A [Neocallimastix lanati (nom. inval.)]|nr:alpha-glucuronidase Gh115A [Neocallimastix sp. JGI-2020a]